MKLICGCQGHVLKLLESRTSVRKQETFWRAKTSFRSSVTVMNEIKRHDIVINIDAMRSIFSFSRHGTVYPANASDKLTTLLYNIPAHNLPSLKQFVIYFFQYFFNVGGHMESYSGKLPLSVCFLSYR